MHNQNLRLKIERYLIYNFNKIKIHSNDINNGEVFIALQGKNFHGSKFIDLAINRGAKYVVSDKKINKNGYKNILYVEDTFSYLKKIAIKKRDKFKGKIKSAESQGILGDTELGIVIIGFLVGLLFYLFYLKVKAR